MIANVQAIHEMDRYIDDVMSGEVVTGTLVRRAVQRHVEDLAKTESGEWPYEFRRDKANQAIEAFPLLFRHTVGQYAGSPFVLSPWQAFIVGGVWGWRCVDGRRRFRRAYCSLARKQGKSTLAAAISILLGNYDDEPQSQVYLGATKADQAKVVFDEACRMSLSCEHIARSADVRVARINFGNSYIKPLGSDRPFSGLNPHGIIFDELHEWKEQHRRFYDTLTTGSSARRQPLRLTITTAGDTKSALWKEENDHAVRVVNGEFREESYFVFIATIDVDRDPFDEANWPMSMPNMALMNLDEPRQLAREAVVSAQSRHRFLRYYANQEVDQIDQAIDPKLWDACQGELSDWRDADVVVGGMDAGGRNDMGATVTVARFHDGFNAYGNPEYRYEVRCRCYMDVDTPRNMTQQPWFEWKHFGKLTVTPIIFTKMRDEMAEDLRMWGARQVGADPHFLRQALEELQADGFETAVIQQTRTFMSEPTDLLISLIIKRRIRHDGSQPILRWALGNLVIAADAGGRWMPDKKNSQDKIDPAVALIMALKLASLAPARPRGALFVT